MSFTEALAEEARGSGVRVTCLAPGPTHTGFATRADIQGARLFRHGVMDSRRVARAGYHGLQRGKTLIIPGLSNRLLAFGVRLTPRPVITKIAAYLGE
jgi:short-subunit dehydrogenase